MSGYVPKRVKYGRKGTKTDQPGLNMQGNPAIIGRPINNQRLVNRRVQTNFGLCGYPTGFRCRFGVDPADASADAIESWCVDAASETVTPVCIPEATHNQGAAGGVGQINNPRRKCNTHCALSWDDPLIRSCPACRPGAHSISILYHHQLAFVYTQNVSVGIEYVSQFTGGYIVFYVVSSSPASELVYTPFDGIVHGLPATGPEGRTIAVAFTDMSNIVTDTKITSIHASLYDPDGRLLSTDIKTIDLTFECCAPEAMENVGMSGYTIIKHGSTNPQDWQYYPHIHWTNPLDSAVQGTNVVSPCITSLEYKFYRGASRSAAVPYGGTERGVVATAQSTTSGDFTSRSLYFDFSTGGEKYWVDVVSDCSLKGMSVETGLQPEEGFYFVSPGPPPPSPTFPGPPGDLTTTVGGAIGSGNIKLTWVAPTKSGGKSVTSYDIFQSSSESGPYNQIFPSFSQPLDTFVTVTGLTNGTPYWFEAKAVNSIGPSQASNPASGVPSAGPAVVPTPPLNLSAQSAGYADVNLAWDQPSSSGGSSITSYNIFQSLTGAVGSYTASTPSSTTSKSVTVTGLTHQKPYWFEVEAVNSVGPSKPSDPATAAPVGATTPGVPGGVAAQSGQIKQVPVNWTAPQDGGAAIDTYQVEVAATGAVTTTTVWHDSLPSATAAVTLVVTGYTGVPSLSDNTTYSFRVRARNAEGYGSYSDGGARATTAQPSPPPSPPSAPLNLTAQGEELKVLLNWSQPKSSGTSPVTSYVVQQAPDVPGSPSQPGAWGAATTAPTTPPSPTSVYATSLTGGDTYWFRVAATNAVGTGPYSITAKATASQSGVPGIPTNITATGGCLSITLEWVKPKHDGGYTITGYDVGITTDDPDGNVAQTWHDASGSLVGEKMVVTEVVGVGPLVDGTSYWLRVRAHNSKYTGAYAPGKISGGHFVGGVECTTAAGSLPLVPRSLGAEGETKEVKLTWEPPAQLGCPEATTYDIQQVASTSDTAPTTGWSDAVPSSVPVGGSAPTTTVTGLADNTKYWLRVAANNHQPAPGGRGPWATVSATTVLDCDCAALSSVVDPTKLSGSLSPSSVNGTATNPEVFGVYIAWTQSPFGFSECIDHWKVYFYKAADPLPGSPLFTAGPGTTYDQSPFQPFYILETGEIVNPAKNSHVYDVASLLQKTSYKITIIPQLSAAASGAGCTWTPTASQYLTITQESGSAGSGPTPPVPTPTGSRLPQLYVTTYAYPSYTKTPNLNLSIQQMYDVKYSNANDKRSELLVKYQTWSLVRAWSKEFYYNQYLKFVQNQDMVKNVFVMAAGWSVLQAAAGIPSQMNEIATPSAGYGSVPGSTVTWKRKDVSGTQNHFAPNGPADFGLPYIPDPAVPLPTGRTAPWWGGETGQPGSDKFNIGSPMILDFLLPMGRWLKDRPTSCSGCVPRPRVEITVMGDVSHNGKDAAPKVFDAGNYHGHDERMDPPGGSTSNQATLYLILPYFDDPSATASWPPVCVGTDTTCITPTPTPPSPPWTKGSVPTITLFDNQKSAPNFFPQKQSVSVTLINSHAYETIQAGIAAGTEYNVCQNHKGPTAGGYITGIVTAMSPTTQPLDDKVTLTMKLVKSIDSKGKISTGAFLIASGHDSLYPGETPPTTEGSDDGLLGTMTGTSPSVGPFSGGGEVHQNGKVWTVDSHWKNDGTLSTTLKGLGTAVADGYIQPCYSQLVIDLTSSSQAIPTKGAATYILGGVDTDIFIGRAYQKSAGVPVLPHLYTTFNYQTFPCTETPQTTKGAAQQTTPAADFPSWIASTTEQKGGWLPTDFIATYSQKVNIPHYWNITAPNSGLPNVYADPVNGTGGNVLVGNGTGRFTGRGGHFIVETAPIVKGASGPEAGPHQKPSGTNMPSFMVAEVQQTSDVGTYCMEGATPLKTGGVPWDSDRTEATGYWDVGFPLDTVHTFFASIYLTNQNIMKLNYWFNTVVIVASEGVGGLRFSPTDVGNCIVEQYTSSPHTMIGQGIVTEFHSGSPPSVTVMFGLHGAPVPAGTFTESVVPGVLIRKVQTTAQGFAKDYTLSYNADAKDRGIVVPLLTHTHHDYESFPVIYTGEYPICDPTTGEISQDWLVRGGYFARQATGGLPLSPDNFQFDAAPQSLFKRSTMSDANFNEWKNYRHQVNMAYEKYCFNRYMPAEVLPSWRLGKGSNALKVNRGCEFPNSGGRILWDPALPWNLFQQRNFGIEAGRSVVIAGGTTMVTTPTGADATIGYMNKSNNYVARAPSPSTGLPGWLIDPSGVSVDTSDGIQRYNLGAVDYTTIGASAGTLGGATKYAPWFARMYGTVGGFNRVTSQGTNEAYQELYNIGEVKPPQTTAFVADPVLSIETPSGPSTTPAAGQYLWQKASKVGGIVKKYIPGSGSTSAQVQVDMTTMIYKPSHNLPDPPDPFPAGSITNIHWFGFPGNVNVYPSWPLVAPDVSFNVVVSSQYPPISTGSERWSKDIIAPVDPTSTDQYGKGNDQVNAGSALYPYALPQSASTIVVNSSLGSACVPGNASPTCPTLGSSAKIIFCPDDSCITGLPPSPPPTPDDEAPYIGLWFKLNCITNTLISRIFNKYAHGGGINLTYAGAANPPQAGWTIKQQKDGIVTGEGVIDTVVSGSVISMYVTAGIFVVTTIAAETTLYNGGSDEGHITVSKIENVFAYVGLNSTKDMSGLKSPALTDLWLRTAAIKVAPLDGKGFKLQDPPPAAPPWSTEIVKTVLTGHEGWYCPFEEPFVIPKTGKVNISSLYAPPPPEIQGKTVNDLNSQTVAIHEIDSLGPQAAIALFSNEYMGGALTQDPTKVPGVAGSGWTAPVYSQVTDCSSPPLYYPSAVKSWVGSRCMETVVYGNLTKAPENIQWINADNQVAEDKDRQYSLATWSDLYGTAVGKLWTDCGYGGTHPDDFGGEYNGLSVLQGKDSNGHTAGGFRYIREFLRSSAALMCGPDHMHQARVGLYTIGFMPESWITQREI